MRVVLDYRPALRERTGIGEYIHELAGALLAAAPPADTLTLFTSSWKDRPDPAALAALPGARVIDRHWPVRALGWTWRRLGWPPIETLCGPTDVAHSPTPLLLPSRTAARLLTIFDVYFLDRPDQVDAHTRRDLLPRVQAHAAAADQIVAGSAYAADLVTARLGVPPDRVTVAPPGVPRWAEEVAGARTAGEGDCLLFVGTLEARKNVGGLLDAYARLLGVRPDAPPLVLAGRATAWAAPLLARAQAAPLAGRVQVTGYVTDAERRALFARARLLVLPSWDEGFGLPALEAMACGVPVVASSRGALPEVVGDAGLLAAPDDPAALAAALARALDRDVALDLAARGRDRAARFSWQASAAATRAAYEAALRHRAGRG